jgi:hypothetical protein
MPLSRIAREMAAEIASHDWSDSPGRLDRAGHQRRHDRSSWEIKQLGQHETECVRTNVMFVTAQVLKHLDPNLDLHEYADACGVPRSITYRKDGSPSGAITHGLRWKDIGAELADKPGAQLWRVELGCEVAHLAAFKRSLWQLDGLDPAIRREVESVESVGGATRKVTVAVREWDEHSAAERAAELVSAAGLAVLDGSPAVVLSVKPIEG